MSNVLRSVFVGFICCGAALAAPILRLSNAAVGPLFIAAGQNGPTQTVTAANAGDGTLTLSASANASWLSPSIVGSSVQIALNTSSLTRNSYTGTIVVSAPSAVDAPQTITVTVQIGSSVPDSMDLYLAAGSSATQTFISGSMFNTSVTNPAGGPTLSVASLGGGSFSFSTSYQVKAQAPTGTGDGDYKGSFTVTGSTISGDNKAVPVTAHVTSQPIANPTAIRAFRIAQGAASQTQYVALSNTGLGTLSASGVTGAPSWLTASVQNNLVTLVASATGMSPGTYTSAISVSSNARNSPTSIPVELDVLTAGPAWTYYRGVLDNAIFGIGDAVAPGGIIALFGEQLTTGPVGGATKLPLGTSLGGATVFVNNQPAPIYYVSAGQIDFMIPYATPPGPAVVRVDRDGQTGNSVSLGIVPTAPRILPIGLGNYGIVVLSDLVTFAIPPTPGLPSRPAKVGSDVIVIYALGLGQTSPPAVDGQAALATQVNPLPTVVFGESLFVGSGVNATPQYAGLTPGLVGLYQINVLVPAGTPLGNAVPIYLNQNGVTSNLVNIATQ
jgi:uncharacterized protein (TIGR03437 family)